MDVFDSMKGRQSIRRFRKDPVPHDKILRMVEAATWAPSAGNAQNARFLVVEDPALLARMKGIVDNLLSRITGKEVPPTRSTTTTSSPQRPPRSAWSGNRTNRRRTATCGRKTRRGTGCAATR